MDAWELLQTTSESGGDAWELAETRSLPRINQINAPILVADFGVTAPVSPTVLPVTAPVTLDETTVDAPVTVTNLLVDAPLVIEIQEVNAPISLNAQEVIAPVYVGQAGPQGEQGIQGEPGVAGGLVVQYLAAAPLGGHRVVVLNTDAQADYADNTDPTNIGKVLGLTAGAAEAGAAATIQTGGEMTEPSWAWTLDAPIFLGASGLLTQTVPTSGFLLVVAFPITATKIFIKLREPLALT